MVTEVLERMERLPWDSFLEEEVSRDARAHTVALETARKMIDRFREVDWPNIKRDLGLPPYNWVVPDGLEPHWVAPGRAVFWQEQVIREPVDRLDGGQMRRVLEDVSRGWTRTSGLPANNPSVIAHYLNKGLRFRPPEAEMAVETLQALVPSEALQAMDREPEPEVKVEYLCSRHGYKHKRFVTWKGYVAHCSQSREPLEYDPPADILNLMKNYDFVCMIHGKGFTSARHAGRHFKSEMRRPGRSVHPTLEQMKVVRENQDG